LLEKNKRELEETNKSNNNYSLIDISELEDEANSSSSISYETIRHKRHKSKRTSNYNSEYNNDGGGDDGESSVRRSRGGGTKVPTT